MPKTGSDHGRKHHLFTSRIKLLDVAGNQGENKRGDARGENRENEYFFVQLLKKLPIANMLASIWMSVVILGINFPYAKKAMAKKTLLAIGIRQV